PTSASMFSSSPYLVHSPSHLRYFPTFPTPGSSDLLILEIYESGKIELAEGFQCLQGLEALDERQARIVELRFFGGLTVEETAEVLEISPATVKRDWILAKIWLRRELSAN